MTKQAEQTVWHQILTTWWHCRLHGGRCVKHACFTARRSELCWFDSQSFWMECMSFFSLVFSQLQFSPMGEHLTLTLVSFVYSPWRRDAVLVLVWMVVSLTAGTDWLTHSEGEYQKSSSSLWTTMVFLWGVGSGSCAAGAAPSEPNLCAHLFCFLFPHLYDKTYMGIIPTLDYRLQEVLLVNGAKKTLGRTSEIVSVLLHPDARVTHTLFLLCFSAASPRSPLSSSLLCSLCDFNYHGHLLWVGLEEQNRTRAWRQMERDVYGPNNTEVFH